MDSVDGSDIGSWAMAGVWTMAPVGWTAALLEVLLGKVCRGVAMLEGLDGFTEMSKGTLR